LGDYDRPDNAKTWYVMTEIPGLNYKDVGVYGCRNWVEYGLNKAKQLGWADFRLTRYQDIEKWWEIVLALTYSLIC